MIKFEIKTKKVKDPTKDASEAWIKSTVELFHSCIKVKR